VSSTYDDSQVPMRLLMLNNEFPPLGGGTGTVNKAILDRLLKVDGWTIDLITSALGREGEKQQYAPNVRLIKVPVNNRNIHHSTGLELLKYAIGALRESRRQHDIRSYNACFAWSTVPAGWVAWRIRRATGLPYIVRICGVDIPGFEARYRYIYPFLAPVLSTIWRGAEKVVTKCRGETDMLRAADPATVPSVVYNGVVIDDFQPSRPPQEGEPLRLICVGRLIERKGQRDLIEAVARLVARGIDVRLSLVGTGDSESSYRRLVNDRGLAGRIEFAGYVPREDMPGQYSRAHVFVLPSYNEGMSVSTLEAMAAGLPLVVSRTGGVEELVEERNNGLSFRPGDIAGLTSHLEALARDASLVRSMGKRSLVRAAAFSWDSAAEAYVHMLKEISTSNSTEKRSGT